MIERRLPNDPVVSTAEWHRDRERANHLEQPWHRERLDTTATMVLHLISEIDPDWLVDLGAGDGGLLQLIGDVDGVVAFGYDFTPANIEGARERGVNVLPLDFVRSPVTFRLPTVVVLAEVLEHLADPHGVLAQLGADPNVIGLVASSPHNETEGPGYEGHLWAWDVAGYEALITGPGFVINDVQLTRSGHTIVAAVRP